MQLGAMHTATGSMHAGRGEDGSISARHVKVRRSARHRHARQPSQRARLRSRMQAAERATMVRDHRWNEHGSLAGRWRPGFKV